jgi:3-dehydroquinate synthase
VGRGLLRALPEVLATHAPGHRYAIISDSTVASLYGEAVRGSLVEAALEADLHTFPAGERHKTRASWAELTDSLLAAGHGRDTVIIALGGGVTGDLAGFLAATYLRGVPLVQVPTTLVAMIDASVGGKTGVDVPAGKNLVGAFHPPRVVVADPETIATLPELQRAQGLAEALKHGAILDAAYFDELQDRGGELLAADGDTLEWAVTRSVEIKAGVVTEDEREGGLRQILNFGHTLGHALEAASDFALPHGSAVSLGMVLEARLGEALGVTEPGTATRIRHAVEAFGLPGTFGREVDVERVRAFTRSDKKGRKGKARYVLIERLGVAAHAEGGWTREVPSAALEGVLKPLS